MNQFTKQTFNNYVNHPLQTFEWGEFRAKTGIKVIRRFVDNVKDPLAFQLTIHKIPHTPWAVGYLPKGSLPTPQLLRELTEIGQQEKCIFIQLEPNIAKDTKILGYKDTMRTAQEQLNILISQYPNLRIASRPLFTKYTFELDLQQNDEELLKNFHSKTRYNIRVAQKKGVTVVEDNSQAAFNEYLRLTNETTLRQKFYAHGETYHKRMWDTLGTQDSIPIPRTKGFKIQDSYNELSAHLLTARYNKKTLVAWIVFVFKNTLYYPYGASSSLHREVMASNLMMWETIQLGKKHNLKTFDMWGALGPKPDHRDPWFGFHRFKEGYGPRLVEFVGSYDLVINPGLYKLFKIANAARWLILQIRK